MSLLRCQFAGYMVPRSLQFLVFGHCATFPNLGNLSKVLFVFFKNKTPAEQRDIFRPKLFYNYINLSLKNSHSTIKTQRSSKKRKL